MVVHALCHPRVWSKQGPRVAPNLLRRFRNTGRGSRLWRGNPALPSPSAPATSQLPLLQQLLLFEQTLLRAPEVPQGELGSDEPRFRKTCRIEKKEEDVYRRSTVLQHHVYSTLQQTAQNVPTSTWASLTDQKARLQVTDTVLYTVQYLE